MLQLLVVASVSVFCCSSRFSRLMRFGYLFVTPCVCSVYVYLSPCIPNSLSLSAHLPALSLSVLLYPCPSLFAPLSSLSLCSPFSLCVCAALPLSASFVRALPIHIALEFLPDGIFDPVANVIWPRPNVVLKILVIKKLAFSSEQIGMGGGTRRCEREGIGDMRSERIKKERTGKRKQKGGKRSLNDRQARREAKRWTRREREKEKEKKKKKKEDERQETGSNRERNRQKKVREKFQGEG